MKSYVCQVCGYTYNEDEGDVSQGIMPRTKFDDLPESFLCPICGVPKTEFQEA